MLIRVNKRISSKNPLNAMELSQGTISHVWHDEESDSLSKQKRRNRIMLTRDTSTAAMRDYDA